MSQLTGRARGRRLLVGGALSCALLFGGGVVSSASGAARDAGPVAKAAAKGGPSGVDGWQVSTATTNGTAAPGMLASVTTRCSPSGDQRYVASGGGVIQYPVTGVAPLQVVQSYGDLDSWFVEVYNPSNISLSFFAEAVCLPVTYDH
jgi:hypothetical protein